MHWISALFTVSFIALFNTCTHADTCASGFIESNAGIINMYILSGNACRPSDTLVPLRNAYIIESTPSRCGAGYYPTSNGCVAYTAGDGCPTNSYTPNQSFTRPGANNACATNYGRINDIELCKSWVADMPYICTPQLPCTSSIATTLRTSTGIILPLYAEKATAPSLHILFPNNDLCYGNFIPGAANNAINVRFNNETYHGVE